jgi:hypothetical protein
MQARTKHATHRVALRPLNLVKRGQEAVDLRRRVVMQQPDTDHAVRFQAERFGQGQSIIVAVPHEDATLSESSREFRGRKPRVRDAYRRHPFVPTGRIGDAVNPELPQVVQTTQQASAEVALVIADG